MTKLSALFNSPPPGSQEKFVKFFTLSKVMLKIAGFGGKFPSEIQTVLPFHRS
jgi:hypothetical protein